MRISSWLRDQVLTRKKSRSIASRRRRFGIELLEDRRVLAVGSVLQTWAAAGDLSGSSQFGTSVSTDGQHTIVGIPFADVPGFSDSGMARVYDNQTGSLLATLHNPTPGVFDLHGFSVAISGSLAAVSTYRDDQMAPDSGSVSIYDWASGTLLRTIHHPSPTGNEQFGFAIDLSSDNGDWLLVGARLDNSGVPGGKAFLFNPLTGSLLATMSNPSGQSGDFFGMQVSVDGGISVVGAPTNDTGASNSGAAYVFDSGGSLIATLANPTPAVNDRFGDAVDISGNSVAIGAYGNDGFRGAAYLFDLTGALQHTVLNPSPQEFDEFGRTVSVTEQFLAVGSAADDTTGINSGIVHLFNTADGSLALSIQNPAPAIGDQFGGSVSLSPLGLVVGASQDDATFVDGGSAYLFQINAPAPPAGADVYITVPGVFEGADSDYSDNGQMLAEVPTDMGELDRVIASRWSRSGADLLIAGWGSGDDGNGFLMANVTYEGEVAFTSFATFPEINFSPKTLLIDDAVDNESASVLLVGTLFGEDHPLPVVARYNFFSDGTLDDTFGDSGIAEIDLGFYAEPTTGIVQPDGGIVLVGVHYENVDQEMFLVRLTSDGELDENFGDAGVALIPGTVSGKHAISLAPDGDIVIADEDNFQVRRFNADGTPDMSFAGGETASIAFPYEYGALLSEVQVQPDGRVVAAAGAFGDLGWQPVLIRLNTDGTLDQSFGEAGIAAVELEFDAQPEGFVLQPDGRIVVTATRFSGEAALLTGLSH